MENMKKKNQSHILLHYFETEFF